MWNIPVHLSLSFLDLRRNTFGCCGKTKQNHLLHEKVSIVSTLLATFLQLSNYFKIGKLKNEKNGWI